MTALLVTVEISVHDLRVWRLSEGITPDAIRFGVAIPLERGARVRLRFELPGGAAVDTEGELVDDHEIALDPAPPQRLAIEAAIEAYLKEQADS